MACHCKFSLPMQVQQEAAAYWWLRAGLAPIALLNMSMSGILQVTDSCIGRDANCLYSDQSHTAKLMI